MRGVPTFKDIQSMDDREIIRVMMPQLGCFQCKRNSGLEIVEVGTIAQSNREGLRKVGAVIYCPTCGLLPRKLEVFVPTTDEAYVKIFALGKASQYAVRRAVGNAPRSKLKSGMSILKKFKLDHLVDRRK